jgi:hypothetical protein
LSGCKSEVEIDTSSILIDTNDFGQDSYLYWVRTKKQNYTYKMLLATNCEFKKCIILKTIKLGNNGKILSQKVNTPSSFQEISPGSAAETTFNYISKINDTRFKSYNEYLDITKKDLNENNFKLARVNAINTYNEALQLSKDGYSKKYSANALALIGQADIGLENFYDALTSLNSAIELAQNYKDDTYTQSLIKERDKVECTLNVKNKSKQSREKWQKRGKKFSEAFIYNGVQLIKYFVSY